MQSVFQAQEEEQEQKASMRHRMAESSSDNIDLSPIYWPPKNSFPGPNSYSMLRLENIMVLALSNSIGVYRTFTSEQETLICNVWLLFGSLHWAVCI